MSFGYVVLGFGGARELVQTLVDRTFGTAIGNMTSNGGLAAAFDGTTVQAEALAAKGNSVATIGKDWGSGNAKYISGVVIVGSSDEGMERNVGSPFNWKLQGSDDNFSNTVDLYSETNVTDSNGLTITVLSGITATTPYRYHRIEFTLGGATFHVAELSFYEDI